MAAKDDVISADAIWLPVIGRTLAFLCMIEAERTKKFESVLDRVDFLERLGLPLADAAGAAGSSKASVDELRRRSRKRKANGKKSRRRKLDDAPPATALDKVAGVLALIAVKDIEPDNAALKLDAIGFSSKEISALLSVGPNYVNVAKFRAKSGKKRKAG